LSLTSGDTETATASGHRRGRPLATTLPAGWPPAWWPLLGIAALLLAGAAWLVHETSGTTFWADEWIWILDRRGGALATFLDPHNSHLSLVPVVIYKALFATVGLRHYWPYRALLIMVQAGTVLLVFVYARRRVGGFIALLVAAMMMFFGPGWQDTLWPFGMGWLIVVAAGVGALLALDRGNRRGDVVASVLLGLALASAGPALAVAAGVLVDVLLRRRPRDLWIPLIPILLYALWTIGYQKAALDIHAIPLLPSFVFHAADGVLSSLAGLADINVNTGHGHFVTWGTPILILSVVLIVLRLVRLGRIPPRVTTLVVMAVGFWTITGVGRAYFKVNGLVFGSTGDESRYLYIGAAFVVLLAVEVLRGWSPSPRWAVLVGAVGCATIISNLGTLHDGSAYLRSAAEQTEGALAALNLDRRYAPPGFVSNGIIFNILTAGPWFAAERDLGSDAVVPGPIPTLDPAARQAADAQLIRLQRLRVPGHAAPLSVPGGAVHPGARRSSGCRVLRPAGPTPVTLVIGASGLRLTAGSAPVAVSVRRFGPGFSALGALPAHGRTTLAVHPDPSPAPWLAQLASPAPLTVCSGVPSVA
jgi:hypothetical protein